MYLGIDLSLRSTGLVAINPLNNYVYKLVTSDSKKLNDEELINYNWVEVCKFIHETNPEVIAIEGLSFGSISGSKDILAGNFWFIRTMLSIHFPNVKVEIVPVLTWRSKLFNKEERAKLKADDKAVKELKKLMKASTKEEKAQLALDNEQLILNSNIKYLTMKKLPEPVQQEFQKLSFTKGCFDLTDAYMICNYIKNKSESEK